MSDVDNTEYSISLVCVVNSSGPSIWTLLKSSTSSTGLAYVHGPWHIGLTTSDASPECKPTLDALWFSLLPSMCSHKWCGWWHLFTFDWGSNRHAHQQDNTNNYIAGTTISLKYCFVHWLFSCVALLCTALYWFEINSISNLNSHTPNIEVGHKHFGPSKGILSKVSLWDLPLTVHWGVKVVNKVSHCFD